MLNFHQWLSEATVSVPAFLQGITTKEELIALIRSNRGLEKPVTDWAEEINKQEYGRKLGTDNPVLLYHGSPQHDIHQTGFKLTKGRRSDGWLGADYEVDNQGVFMTDSPALAKFFGDNRAEYTNGATIYQAYTNLDRCLNATKPGALDLALRKLGLGLSNDYYGEKKKKLANRDIWWLLDRPDFVNAVKKMGYTAVKFKEDVATVRTVGEKAGNSYCVFDPSTMIIRHPKNNLIKTLDDLVPFLTSAS